MSVPRCSRYLSDRRHCDCGHDALSRHFVFGIYRGGDRYEIYFEKFADEIVLNREHRAEGIQHWTERNVDRLEYYARLAPYNWFNFYRFWD